MTRTTNQFGTHRRGFTLMEALVAVIGVAILSVGLATIFSAISKTVTTGRRVSAINNYAAVVERVLRDDFDKMTREGFLVIRNEFALNLNGVPLSPDLRGDTRPRRIDEIMFFARGQFESARTPIDPNFIATSSSASIYYGHGQEKLEGTNGFATPFLDETNEGPFLRHGVTDFDQTIGEINPNFYAGDWTLLRQVRLLKNPQPHPAGVAGPLGLPAPPTNYNPSSPPGQVLKYQDNELQIAGQPAAAGIFRVETITGRPFNSLIFDAGTDPSFRALNLRDEAVSPLFESGVVDVATASLIDIKQRMTQVYGREALVGSAPMQYFAPTPSDVYLLRDRVNQIPQFNPNVNKIFIFSPRDIAIRREASKDTSGNFTSTSPFGDKQGINANVTGLQTLVKMQHAWMADALPGRSNELMWEGEQAWGFDPDFNFRWRGVDPRMVAGGGAIESPYGRNAYENRIARTRMRYENTPPGYNADVFGPDAAAEPNAVLQAAYRADQQLVGASQFIPRCTEFIVEYSFGEIDPANGQVIWYGHDPEGLGDPARKGRVNWLRPIDPRPEPFTTGEPYLENKQRLIEKHLRADLVNGLHTENDSRDRNLLRVQPIRYPISHYFGYADPRAVPLDTDNDGIVDGYDMNEDGIADDIDGDGVSTDEWPWPRLVRITMSFADPIDQTTEETFQFVIDIPTGEGI